MLDCATGRIDGKNAAASTARRHRTILANAMDYAVELGLLDSNPDPGPQVNGAQDVRPGEPALRGQPEAGAGTARSGQRSAVSGPRLVAFFGLMYYAALRPEEAIHLAADDMSLPAPGPDEDDAWGMLYLHGASPDTGREWTDDGSARERRQLRHRAEGDSRTVPAHPELVCLLRDHLAAFGTSPDGRLFSGIRGGELPTITYRRSWIKARQAALTPAEQASPLVRRPYDLRHACLSTWLNGGVYPTQVAEWAGHSVDVLLRIYAKCIAGQDELAKRRIAEALCQD